MSYSDLAIRVINLSKCYQIYETPRDRLKQFVMPRVRRMLGKSNKQYFREFWALKDVSFEIKKGETVGIIGRNGSGKSTLLQMICGTLTPTNGSIQTNGRIAALLELGSGFNPEFTGRENIYLNAAVLGLTKHEIDLRYDDIVNFAEIGEFLNQPVKTYSSGMLMRLAFSVAINTSPEVLIVDEALAVGDFQFQNKCYKKIKAIKDLGTTIILVTHDLTAISQFCDWAILISNGKKISTGKTSKVINDFKQDCFSKEIKENKSEKSNISFTNKTKGSSFYAISSLHESGNQKVKIIDWYLSVDNDNNPVTNVSINHICTLTLIIQCFKSGSNPNVGFFFSDARGNEIAGSAINHENFYLNDLKEGDIKEIKFTFNMILKPGPYFLNLGCSEFVASQLISYHRLYSLTEILVTGSKDLIGSTYLSPQISINNIE